MQNKTNPNPNFLVFLALEAAGAIPVTDNQNSFAPQNNFTSLLAKLNLTGRLKPDTTKTDLIKAEQAKVKVEQEKKECEVKINDLQTDLKSKESELKSREGELKVKKAELQIRLDAEEKKRKIVEEKKKEKEFKKAVEKMVDQKIEEEVAKRIENKVEKIVEEHNNQKYRSNILTQDRHLFPEPERNTFTLEKHKRFWEVEKRIQEHKEKYQHTFFDMSPTSKETGSNKSYISALRGKLVTMPTLASQLRTDHSNSMIDYTEEKYQDTTNISVLGKHAKESEYLYDGYGGHKQEEEETSIETAKPVLKGRLPQRKKEAEYTALIPKLQEMAVGKSMLKNIVSTFGNSPYIEKPGSRNSKIGNKERVRTEDLVEMKEKPSIEEEEVRKSQDVKDSDRSSRNGESLRLRGVDVRKDAEDVGDVTMIGGGLHKDADIRLFDGTPKIVNVRRQQSLSPLRCDYYANNKRKLKGSKVKRSTSVIEEVNEAVTFRCDAQQPQKEASAPRIKMTSESIVRQMYRIKENPRKESSAEMNDRINTTFEASSPNKSYIEKLIRERRKSGDFLNPIDMKAWGFASAQKTRVGALNESPGAKHDISQYKGVLGTENKSVRANRYGEEKGEKDSSATKRYNMDKHTRGVSFGTARRDISAPARKGRNASVTENNGLPKLKNNQIDLFARERKTKGSPFMDILAFDPVRFA